MNKRIVFIFINFFICVFLYAIENPIVNYKNESKYYMGNKSLNKADGFIEFSDAKTLVLYTSEQIAFFLQNWDSEIEKLDDRYGDYHCFYISNENINCNGMILTKALFFRGQDNWVLPGFCLYINLDDEYRRRHSYIDRDEISTVFDNNGNPYLLVDSDEKIYFYKLNTLEMEQGAIYPYHPYSINYINNDTKQVMVYKILEGENKLLRNMPPLNKPKLFFGENINKPSCIEDLILFELNEVMRINPHGIAYHDNLIERGWDGTHIYNTLYLLDYDFDGTRKKGVYKIMGDKFEFYPDL